MNSAPPAGPVIRLILNGESRSLPAPLTVAEVVVQTSQRSSGIAVALNNEVVPRSEWGSTAIADGDQLDIVTAVQGG
jgi:sulfur carrier protein